MSAKYYCNGIRNEFSVSYLPWLYGWSHRSSQYNVCMYIPCRYNCWLYLYATCVIDITVSEKVYLQWLCGNSLIHMASLLHFVFFMGWQVADLCHCFLWWLQRLLAYRISKKAWACVISSLSLVICLAHHWLVFYKVQEDGQLPFNLLVHPVLQLHWSCYIFVSLSTRRSLPLYDLCHPFILNICIYVQSLSFLISNIII